MRNAMVQLCLVLIGVSSVHAVKLLQASSMHTQVFPADAAERVYAIQGKDTSRLTGTDGEFYLTGIHPGLWQIRVEAKKPFHNATLKGIELLPGSNRDLGLIRLSE